MRKKEFCKLAIGGRSHAIFSTESAYGNPPSDALCIHGAVRRRPVEVHAPRAGICAPPLFTSFIPDLPLIHFD